MPQFIVPRQRSIHRASSIALFRALLSQSRTVPLSVTERDGLQHLIRNKFRYNIYLASWRLLRLAFTAGYEAINILDSSASGSESAITRIRSLLATTKPHLLQPPPRRRPVRVKNNISACKPVRQGVIENWSDTTRLALDGKRQRVPTLINACRFPMLRFQKPQPKNLSRLLRFKITQRNKRYVTMMQLEREVPIAESEDVWDQLLERYCQVVSTSEEVRRQFPLQTPGSLRWKHAVKQSIAEIKARITHTSNKATEDAMRMLKIVEREKELTRKEMSGSSAPPDQNAKGNVDGRLKAKVTGSSKPAPDFSSSWNQKKAEMGLDSSPVQAKITPVVVVNPEGETPLHI